MHPICVCGIVAGVDPRGGFWVVRPDLVGVARPGWCGRTWLVWPDLGGAAGLTFFGVWPMDLVPLDIILSVESFGKVWC
jgi:hypothetical protein